MLFCEWQTICQWIIDLRWRTGLSAVKYILQYIPVFQAREWGYRQSYRQRAAWRWKQACATIIECCTSAANTGHSATVVPWRHHLDFSRSFSLEMRLDACMDQKWLSLMCQKARSLQEINKVISLFSLVPSGSRRLSNRRKAQRIWDSRL